MKSLRLLGVVGGVLLVTALVSPWVAWGLAAARGRPFTFARVYDRVFEVLLAAGVALAWRPLDLGDAAAIGLQRREWARALARGLMAGFAGLAAGLAMAAVLGAVAPALRFPLWKTVRKALLGLAAAFAIGAGEEVVFRGVLLRRLRRDLGTVLAVALTAVVYAGVHVIRARGTAGAVHVTSGMAQTIGLFAPLLGPAALPQLAGLALLGVVLAVARLRSGTLWLPIGVHAAFVAGFRVGRLLFVIRPEPAWLVGSGWPPLIGGLAGWVAIGVAALLAV